MTTFHGTTRQERRALADWIRSSRGELAEMVTARFLALHGDPGGAVGGRSRLQWLDDILFHLDFLAGAVEAGSARSYERYGQWVGETLSFRGVPLESVANSLEALDDALGSRLTSPGRDLVRHLVQVGTQGCRAPGGEETDSTAGPLEATREVFLRSSLQGHRQGALRAVTEAFAQGHTLLDVYMEVIEPSLVEVGRLWQSGQVTVATEHVASAVAQFAMAQMYADMPGADRSRGRALITGVRGELHQIGPNLIADLLESDGWDVRFLGTHLPTQDILQAVREHEPALVGVSVTMLFNLPEALRLIEALKAEFPSVRVVVGGQAFRLDPLIAQVAGVDTAPNARSAVELCRRIAHPDEERDVAV